MGEGLKQEQETCPEKTSKFPKLGLRSLLRDPQGFDKKKPEIKKVLTVSHSGIVFWTSKVKRLEIKCSGLEKKPLETVAGRGMTGNQETFGLIVISHPNSWN